MAPITFSQIFFAIAMIFLKPDAKITKIYITMDGQVGAEWVLQADGSWHGRELARHQNTDTGAWTYDAAKKTLTQTPPANLPDAKPVVTDLNTFFKLGPEKPEPATLEINGGDGTVLLATRKGSDIVITTKDSGNDPTMRPVIIHYEKADAPAATATPAASK